MQKFQMDGVCMITDEDFWTSSANTPGGRWGILYTFLHTGWESI